MPRHEGFPFAKFVVVLAVAFVIGMGLCGADIAFLDRFRNPGNEFGPNTVVGAIGALAMVLSALGLVITLIMWLVYSVTGSFNRKDSEPQRLFHDKEDNDDKPSP